MFVCASFSIATTWNGLPCLCEPLPKISENVLLFELGRQMLWVLIMTLVVRIVLAAAAHRVVVQGG